MTIPARRLLVALALLLTFSGVVAARHTRAATPPAVAVTIKNFAFVPQAVTIKPGTTVTWTNVDEDPHTATSTTGAFRSTALDTGAKYSFTFTKPGDYAYFCQLHPHMTGKIIVR